MSTHRSTTSVTTPVNTNTLSQQVYAHLRAGILDSTYPPGSSLPEEAMAAKLNVSRVPIREALRRLSAEGLVTVVPRQGATVTELTSKQFLDAYQAKFKDYPRLGSVVGYATVMSAAEAIKKAGSLDQEKLVAAMSGLTLMTPFGMVQYRPIDHQSTMGAYVGRIGVKDGKGFMKEWRFVDGKDALPPDAEIMKLRPKN